MKSYITLSGMSALKRRFVIGLMSIAFAPAWVQAQTETQTAVSAAAPTTQAPSAQAVPPTRDATSHFFDQNFGNLQEEAQTAKAENKLGVFIMFEQADCPWCAKMMSTVLNQVSVQDYYRKYFRIVQVDIKGDNPLTDFAGKEMTEKEFAFAQRVRATPVFAFFGIDGKQLTKFTGAVKDPREFMLLGEFVVGGAYKTQNFTAYKREKSAGSAS